MNSTHTQPKILLIGAGLSGGGGERHFNMLAKWLYHGSADILLTTRPGVMCYREAVFPLRNKALITYHEALHRCRSHAYDAIVGFSRYPAFTAWWIRKTCCQSTPLILMDISVFLRAHSADTRWLKSLPLMACRMAYSRANLLLANSISGTQDLTTLTRGQTMVRRMPNLIDPEWIQLGSDGRLPDCFEGSPYILALGRLVPSKRLDSAIRAFANICSQIPHRLVVAGDGPERERLASLVKLLKLEHRVLFCGWVNEPLPLLKHAAALIHTSTLEGYPNSILEAMSLHIPVISGNWGLDACSLADNGALQLVKSEDPQSIAQALLAVLVDRDVRNQLISKANSEILEHRVPKAIEPYESAIASVLA
jgi:glycosyltransferase involved in cell wall biosynthesis